MLNVILYKEDEILPHLGGIARINSNLMEALIIRGYTVYFISATRNPKLQPAACQEFLPVLGKELCDENQMWLKKFIIEHSVSVIVNSSFSQETIQLLEEARKGTKCKLVSWIHNNIIEYSSKIGYRKEQMLINHHLTPVYRLITSSIVISFLRMISRIKHHKTAEMLYRLSDKVVVVSDSNVDEYKYLIGDEDKEFKIIPINNFVLSQQQLNDKSEKEKIVVWCGNIDFGLKKTNWMLEIWSKIEDKYPDWKLYILGDSTSLDTMKEYAKSLGIGNVEFTGRVAPYCYYRKASIICSTSVSESFGLTVIEGMQSKAVPCVFACSPAIKDIVRGNGMLVRAFKRGEFVNALSFLMQNSDTREFLAEKSYIACSQYEDNKIVRLWEKLFEVITTQ